MSSARFLYSIVLAAALAATYSINVTAQTASAQQGQNAKASAIQAPTPDDVVTLATPASANAQSSSDSFDDWVASFEKQFQKVGVASDGKMFFSGSAATLVGPTDPNFGAQLQLAYEKAMFDMRADFILQTYGRLKEKTIREQLEDNSTKKDDFDPVEIQKAAAEGGNRLNNLFDKALTVMDKKLDNELIAQGVPADQVQRSTIEQKKTTYKDNLFKDIAKTAFRNMQGLVPVQTKLFTKKTDNGTQVIVGVIAVQSEKTRQFALDISRKRPTTIKGTSQKLSDILPKEKSSYLDEIGLRFTYDEVGRPMLISYGRSSLSIMPDWTPSRVFQSTKNAKAMAQSLAEASISEFMNTDIEVAESKITGSQEEVLTKQITSFENGTKAGVQKIQEKVAETIRKSITSGTSRSEADLRGMSVANTWELKDEYGVLQVGTVVIWTYGQLDNANRIEAQATGQASSAAPAADGAVKDSSRSSRMINKKDDF